MRSPSTGKSTKYFLIRKTKVGSVFLGSMCITGSTYRHEPVHLHTQCSKILIGSALKHNIFIIKLNKSIFLGPSWIYSV